jgi:predicted Zn-dependent protease
MSGRALQSSTLEVIEQELWSDALADYSTDSKIALAKELERLTLATDPRIRVDDANYADVASESAVATTTGIRRTGRENGCYVVVSTMADDADDPDRVRLQRRPVARRVRSRQGRAGSQRPGHPSAGRDEAVDQAHHGRA